MSIRLNMFNPNKPNRGKSDSRFIQLKIEPKSNPVTLNTIHKRFGFTLVTSFEKNMKPELIPGIENP